MSFKVYTKTGDKGTTALIGGTRVRKDNIRIEAYGTVDELNSCIGIITAYCADDTKDFLLNIQDKLFVIGSMLATDPNKDVKMSLPQLNDEEISNLEQTIDKMEAMLKPLKNFILPGGSVLSAHTHIARCVCRRAERIIVHIKHEDGNVPQFVLAYLNRLSDYLFVLSRYFLHIENIEEIPWLPNRK